jgi:hypothetical protein
VTKRVSVTRYFALAEHAWHGRKKSWIESWSNKVEQGSKLSLAICINYDVDDLADSTLYYFSSREEVGGGF